jgi:cellulose synthase/poly-beta-1,6-N-acetylglucosamine synthase-like glycosyltransferase
MALEIVFWACAGLLVYAQVGYPLVLWLLAGRRSEPAAPEADPLPSVSLIVAAHDEEASIVGWVRSTLAFEYPRDRLQVVVVSDGSTDRTVELAVRAGADLAFEVPRGGKARPTGPSGAQAAGAPASASRSTTTWVTGSGTSRRARSTTPPSSHRERSGGCVEMISSSAGKSRSASSIAAFGS